MNCSTTNLTQLIRNIFSCRRGGAFSAISCPTWWGICRFSHAIKTNRGIGVYSDRCIMLRKLCQRQYKWFLNTFKYRAKLVQAFAFQLVRQESGIFRFQCMKACLRHDLSCHVESARLVTASDQISQPLWVVIKCPAPGKTKLSNSLPLGQEKTSNARGMPGGGTGGDVEASNWLIHYKEKTLGGRLGLDDFRC